MTRLQIKRMVRLTAGVVLLLVAIAVFLIYFLMQTMNDSARKQM